MISYISSFIGNFRNFYRLWQLAKLSPDWVIWGLNSGHAFHLLCRMTKDLLGNNMWITVSMYCSWKSNVYKSITIIIIYRRTILYPDKSINFVHVSQYHSHLVHESMGQIGNKLIFFTSHQNDCFFFTENQNQPLMNTA